MLFSGGGDACPPGCAHTGEETERIARHLGNLQAVTQVIHYPSLDAVVASVTPVYDARNRVPHEDAVEAVEVYNAPTADGTMALMASAASVVGMGYARISGGLATFCGNWNDAQEAGRPRPAWYTNGGPGASWVTGEALERLEGRKRPSTRYAGPSLARDAPAGEESRDRPVMLWSAARHVPKRISRVEAGRAHEFMFVNPELLGVLQHFASGFERTNLLKARLKTEADRYMKGMDLRQYTACEIACMCDLTVNAAMDVPLWEQAGIHFLAGARVQRNMRMANEAYGEGKLPRRPGYFSGLREWWSGEVRRPTLATKLKH